jgi:hypothetical protein
MDYIRQIKKPRELIPGTFLIYLRIQNSMVQDLPGSTGGFNDIQLRRIYLQAMPPTWQSTFQDANKTATDTTLHSMRTYFDRQYYKDPYTSTVDPYQKTNSAKPDKHSDKNPDKDSDNENIDNQDIEADNQGSADNQGNFEVDSESEYDPPRERFPTLRSQSRATPERSQSRATPEQVESHDSHQTDTHNSEPVNSHVTFFDDPTPIRGSLSRKEK